MKIVLWIIIVAMALIVLNEVSYLEETSLALVIMAIAASVGVLAFNAANNCK